MTNSCPDSQNVFIYLYIYIIKIPMVVLNTRIKHNTSKCIVLVYYHFQYMFYLVKLYII